MSGKTTRTNKHQSKGTAAQARKVKRDAKAKLTSLAQEAAAREALKPVAEQVVEVVSARNKANDKFNLTVEQAKAIGTTIPEAESSVPKTLAEVKEQMRAMARGMSDEVKKTGDKQVEGKAFKVLGETKEAVEAGNMQGVYDAGKEASKSKNPIMKALGDFCNKVGDFMKAFAKGINKAAMKAWKAVESAAAKVNSMARSVAKSRSTGFAR